MDTQTINTPENLYQAIVKFLESNYSHEDAEKTYNDARKCVMRFCGYYPLLLTLPACKEKPLDALDGLKNIMQWCTEANKAVDDIVSNLKRQTIDKMISQFKKLRGFADKVLSLVDKKLQNETRAKYAKKRAQEQARFQAEIDRRLLAAQKASAAAPGIRLYVDSPLVLEAQIRADILKETGFILSPEESEENKAVQSYLSKDPTFNDRLSRLDKEIHKVLKEINKLAGNNTSDGKLIDIYCKLRDIPRQQQYDEVSYSFTDLADIIFGNCNRLYTSVDNVIKTLENIQTKTESETWQNNTPAKRGMFKRITIWIFKKTWHLIVAIIVAIIGSFIAAILIRYFW